MGYDYSGNILVQESGRNLLRDELGWDVQFAFEAEKLGKDGTLGIGSYKEILSTWEWNSSYNKKSKWTDRNKEGYDYRFSKSGK